MVNLEKITVIVMAGICLLLSGCSTGPTNSRALSDEEIALHNASLTNFAQPTRWHETIAQFKEQDKKSPPPQNTVLFVGSSSIVGWNTKKWFPDVENINRGFGGSQINDSWYYAESIIIPYKPKTIVFYAGDNDAADGKSPEMIFANFKAFALKIRKALPKTRLIYISIKPSIDRWNIWPQMQEANGYIKNYCEKQKKYVFRRCIKGDVGFILANRLKNIFSPDGLHMNETGYRLWTAEVRPLIDK